MPTLGRRAFLKRTAAVSAAAAATMVPGIAIPQAAAVEDPAALPRWHRVPCQLCGVGCGLLVAVEQGRAVAARGDPDSPSGQGFACVKGYHAVQTLYGRDRLTRALIRRGGALHSAPLSEALDLVSRRIRTVLAEHGPAALAVFGGDQWTIPDGYVAARLFRGGLGCPNVESTARLQSGSARAGLIGSFGLDGAIGCYEDLDAADVFVLWDLNLAETDPVLFSRMLARKRRNPSVRIVELATRTTRTSHPADESLRFIPQTGPAIANALAHEIVERRWTDRDFIARHVAMRRGVTGIGNAIPDGPLRADEGQPATWDEYVAFLAGYSPGRVERLSGVPAARLRWLAALYGDRSRRVMSLWGAGLNGSSRGTWMNNLLYNLHLLTGKLGTPGNAPLCVTGLTGGESGGPAAESAPEPPGHHALGLFRALERGEIRFLWIQGANPMISLPELDRYRRAAARPGNFIVVSDAYPTPTTDGADVVLPAALWIERDGIVVNLERRIQHWDGLVPPPGEATSDAWLMIELARRLDRGSLFPWSREEHIARIWEEYRRLRPDARSLPASLEALRSRPGIQWPTPGGRETPRRYHRASDPAADPARGQFDFYGHADHRAWIWLRPYEPPAEAPDREYPLWLGTVDVLEHSGSGTLTQRVPTLHRSIPRAYVEVHQDDARALGIRSGEPVRLVTRRGSIELPARIDYRAQPAPGMVFVPRFDEASPIARLLLDAGCPLSGQPEARCAARLERVDSRSGP